MSRNDAAVADDDDDDDDGAVQTDRTDLRYPTRTVDYYVSVA